MLLQNENYRSRLYYADLLRVLATISVIVLHVSASLPEDYNKIDSTYWFASNMFISMNLWCVPIFILLSGMLLLDSSKSYSNKDFFNKRFSKIVWPFLFWSFIYQLRYYRSEIISSKTLPLGKISEGIIKGPVSYHLWFVYLLMVLYLLIPILKEYLSTKSQKEIQNILKVWFGIILFEYIFKFVFKIETGINFYIHIISYAGYLILGYYLKQFDVTIKFNWTCVFIAIALLTITGTYLLKYFELDRDKMFYDYLTPGVILMSVAIFYSIKNINFSTSFFNNLIVHKSISFVSKISYGIYLAHILVLSLLNTQLNCNGVYLLGRKCSPFIGIPVTSLFVFIISLLVILIMYRLPFIKRIAY